MNEPLATFDTVREIALALPAAGLRIYEAQAETTSTFGRVSCAVRQHRLTVDGPVQNGCPETEPETGG